MYQGPGVDLTKNQSGIFEGELEIPDLDDGIFYYEFFIKKDSAGQMLPVNYKPKEEKEYFFKWIGDNREANYTKAIELKGSIIQDTIKSGIFERSNWN